MELHVTGRHVQVPEDFRQHVDDRLSRLEPMVSGDRWADVVVTKDGRGDGTIAVEVTLHGKSPVIRAEAHDADKLVAFDHAFAKLQERIKKANDRRRSGRRRVVTAPPAAPDLVGPSTLPAPQQPGAEAPVEPGPEEQVDDGPDVVELKDTPIEVRVKRHQAGPMSIEQAVYEMEMVGHDFYLFTDADTGLPSVMYRRRGWSYGVLHLEPQQVAASA